MPNKSAGDAILFRLYLPKLDLLYHCRGRFIIKLFLAHCKSHRVSNLEQIVVPIEGVALYHYLISPKIFNVKKCINMWSVIILT